MLGAHAAFVGSNPTEVGNICMDYVSTVVEKDKCAATDKRNIIILHRHMKIVVQK